MDLGSEWFFANLVCIMCMFSWIIFVEFYWRRREKRKNKRKRADSLLLRGLGGKCAKELGLGHKSPFRICLKWKVPVRGGS